MVSLDHEKTPPHTLRTNHDEGYEIFLSNGFNSYCDGIDGHKTLASPDVNTALCDILTSRRPLFWEQRTTVIDGTMEMFQNLLVLLLIIDVVRRLRKSQGMDRTDIDELIALVPEE